MVCVVVDTSKSCWARLRPVAIEAVKLSDRFWAPRLKALVETTLPSQYELLEETGRIDNFRRASGKLRAEFKGLFFNDSDVYKWVEACAFAMAYEPNPKIASLIDKVAAEIIAAQDEDGYLNTYFTFERKALRFKDLQKMHELYCAGHLIQAAIAYHRAVGDRSLLEAAVRFADHIADTFKPGGVVGVGGHPEIEMAMVELYRETGEKKYLETAEFFLNNRGKGLIGGGLYFIDHKPFRELDEVVGHAVRSIYLNCGATDIYMETGETLLFEVLNRIWLNMVGKKMYITGGLGSRYEGEAFGEDYELPNERAYSETCAAVANVMWNWRMLLATGEARFADIAELALYNAALAGISLDGKSYFYVNPLADRSRHRRQPWFSCACCPPNIARLLASLPGYFYSLSSEGIWVHLYASGKAEISFRNGKVEVLQQTDYPWSGRVRLVLNPDVEDEFSLFLRIPGWSEGAKISVNRRPLGRTAKPSSYLELRRTWRAGDTVELSIPMPIRLMVSHPFITYNISKVSIKRGPLVYCLEQVDNPGSDVWDLAIRSDSKMVEEFKPELLNGVIVVKGEGLALDRTLWSGNLYLPLDKLSSKTRKVKFKAIPYYAWANREAGPMAVWIPMIDYFNRIFTSSKTSKRMRLPMRSVRKTPLKHAMDTGTGKEGLTKRGSNSVAN